MRQIQPLVKKQLFRKMPLKVCFIPVVFANSPTRPAEHSECTRNCVIRKSSVSVRDMKRQQGNMQLPPNIIVRNASFFLKTVKAFENTIEKSIGYLIVNYVTLVVHLKMDWIFTLRKHTPNFRKRAKFVRSNSDQMNHGTYATSVTILVTPLLLYANILGKCLIILKNNIHTWAKRYLKNRKYFWRSWTRLSFQAGPHVKSLSAIFICLRLLFVVIFHSL